jgi:probable rRNA maturation factor
MSLSNSVEVLTPSVETNHIIDEDRWCSIDLSFVDGLILHTLKVANWQHGALVSVTFSNDAQIQELNKTYRQQDKPTNVLSFPAWDVETLTLLPHDFTVPVGDIFLAFETIEREANIQHKTFLDHLSHLIVHGTLHLLGYDHLTDDEALEMEALEVSILKHFSISNPYEGTQ